MAVETFCQYFQSALNFAGKQFKHLDLVLDTNTCTWFYIRIEGCQDFHRTATSFVDKLNNLICSKIAITPLTVLGRSPSQISDCHLLLLHGRWEKKTSLVTALSPTFPPSNCRLARLANAAQCFSNDRFYLISSDEARSTRVGHSDYFQNWKLIYGQICMYCRNIPNIRRM